MKVTIDFEQQDLAPVIQEHLEKGISVQHYVQRAVAYFNVMLTKERAGHTVGYSGNSRGSDEQFRRYNFPFSAERFLAGDTTCPAE